MKPAKLLIMTAQHMEQAPDHEYYEFSCNAIRAKGMYSTIAYKTVEYYSKLYGINEDGLNSSPFFEFPTLSEDGRNCRILALCFAAEICDDKEIGYASHEES